MAEPTKELAAASRVPNLTRGRVRMGFMAGGAVLRLKFRRETVTLAALKRRPASAEN